MSKRKVSSTQMSLFDEAAFVDDKREIDKRAIEEQIIRKQTELVAGERDYQRLLPSKKAFYDASLTKHSNRAKVNGEWYDVKFCKYISGFLGNWVRRRSQLEWEVSELMKLLV